MKSRVPLLTELIRDIRREAERRETRKPCHCLNKRDDVPDFRALPSWLTSSLSSVNYCERTRELLISLNEYNHNIWWPSSVEHCRQTLAPSDTKKPDDSTRASTVTLLNKWTSRMSRCVFSWSSWLCVSSDHSLTSWDTTEPTKTTPITNENSGFVLNFGSDRNRTVRWSDRQSVRHLFITFSFDHR